MTRRVAATLVVVGCISASAGLPAQPSAGDRVPPGLLARLNAGETVRVVVELREPDDADGPSGPERAARARAGAQARFVQRTQGQRVKRLSSRAIVALDVDAQAIAELTLSPDVVSVREDGLRKPSLGTSVPLIGAPDAWALGAGGAGWSVAVLDTGVQKTHPMLSGKVVAEACYSTTAGNAASLCPNGTDTTAAGSAAPCGWPVTGCEHGTHVAGIAAGRSSSLTGVARDASVVAMQVFSRVNDSQFCYPDPSPCVGAYDSDILAGLDRVYALRTSFDIAAANLSLGSGLYTTTCDTAFPAYKSMIDLLRGAGIATVVSSGNGGAANAISTPACISSAISVGATTKGDQVASYSNRGPSLKLLAPGSGIRSSVPGGYATYSGTSMAAPHVAGAWALLKSRQPGAAVSSILATLTTTGLSIYDSSSGTSRRRIRVGVAAQQTAPGGPTITTFVAEPSLPQPANVPITWTTRAFTGSVTPQYKYWLFDPYAGGWVVLREYSAERSAIWTPVRPGTYAVQVWVRATGSTAAYEAWQSSGFITIVSAPVSLTTVTADRTSPLPPGAPVTFTALGRGGSGPLEYEFRRVDATTQSTVLVQAYSPSNTYTWTPEASDTGSFFVNARVRTLGSTAAFEATADSAVFSLLGPRSFVLNSQAGDYVGMGQYRLEGGPGWTASAATWEGTPVELSFLRPDYSSWWYFNFSAPGRAPLAPGVYENATRYPFEQPGAGLSIYGDGRGCNQLTGRFVVQDIARVSGVISRFAGDFEQHCEGLTPALFGSVRYNSTVPPSDRPVQIQSFGTAAAFPAPANQPLTWTTTAIGGGPPLQYKYWLYSASSGWAVIQDGPSNVLTWTPAAGGTYALQVWVRSLNSQASYEAWSGSGFFTVEGPPVTPVTITAFTATTTFPVPVNTVIGWTATAAGGSGSLEYQYWLYNGNSSAWSIVQAYGPSGEMSWQPSQPGTYAVQVWVRAVGSGVNWQDWRSTGYFTVTPAP